jgi:acetyl-CoA acetyltransferase
MKNSAIVSVAITEWTAAGSPTPLLIDRLAEVAVKALREAKMKPGQLDAIIANTTAIPFDNKSYITTSAQHFAHRLAERIGIKDAQCINVCAACASASIAFALADSLIKTGSIKSALVAGIDNSPSGFYLAGQSVLDPDPYAAVIKVTGATNPSYWAMWARRRAYEMGEPIEKIKELMAFVKEMHSVYGARNPYARYKRIFSTKDVLSSPVVCDPLHLYMICGTSTGGGAAVLMDGEIAKKITEKPVNIAASTVGGPIYGEPMPRLRVFSTVGGKSAEKPFKEWRIPIERAYKLAGINADDIDIIECHDTSCFHTINWIDQIMGWEREETDKLIEKKQIGHDGILPVNLSGGTASFGEAVMSQAFIMIHELFRQLRNEAQERQAKKNLNIGLCTAYGAYGAYGCIILEKGW